MSWTSSKGYQSVNAYPRALSWIAVSVGGLALFLTIGSLILVSSPVGSTVRGYFNTFDSSESLDLSLSLDSTKNFPRVDNVDENVTSGAGLQFPTSETFPVSEGVDNSLPSESDIQVSETSLKDRVVVSVTSASSLSDDNKLDEKVPGEPKIQVPLSSNSPSNHSDATKNEDLSSGTTNEDIVKGGTSPSNVTDNDQMGDSMGTRDTKSAGSDSNSGDMQTLLEDSRLPSSTSGTDSGCDLYQGSWIYDSRGPLYTNNTCPVLTQMQNCQGNGRPDKDYENWRWKPEKCELPRFDARKFLELMRGKTIAFIGDSVARNQMESLLCILWQEEVPKNRGNKKMQRYYFKSTSTMVVRFWSSWLVKQTTEAVDSAPEGIVKLHLDAPDEKIIEYSLNFDVIVLSSGHWFAKQSVYLVDNKVVGGQLWWPNKSTPMKVNNIKALGISTDTILTALGTHPNYTGLTIVRSFSPDHYEGGAWNTGGSCTGKTKPLAAGEVVENGFTNIMHEKQVSGFNSAMRKATNKSKARLMDITGVFEYRHDGHPGPYRNTDPNKLTKRGPDGKPPPQDCLHWCMPGPVDTWNELVFEIIRREYEDNKSFSKA